jgi:MYXO-CTERM domain-containing protein
MFKSSLFAAGLVSLLASAASADVIAGWSMSTVVAAATTGSNYTYGAADLGALTSGTSLSGFHTASATTTTWTSPAGNGSTYSLSSNNWTTGDYYQVSMATTGYSDISVSWDQTRSGTGPSAFSLTMSTDGGANFTTLLASYTVVQAGGTGTGTTGWSAAGLYQTGFTTTTIVGISAANQGNILLRFNSLSTPAVGGTNRVDNISVTGALVAVPSPGAIALIGLAGLVARRRR